MNAVINWRVLLAQLTVRADSVDEFAELLEKVPYLAPQIQEAHEHYRAVVLVKDELGGTVIREQSGPTRSASSGSRLGRVRLACLRASQCLPPRLFSLFRSMICEALPLSMRPGFR